MPNLMLLFFIPFIAAAVVSLIPLAGKSLKWLSITLSLFPLALLLYNHSQWVGSEVNTPWLPILSVRFHLSIDSLSLLFLYLTALIVPFSLLALPSNIATFSKGFYSLVLILEGLLIGFFTANDLVLFTIFWEAMLLPLYFLINIWGKEQRHMAALKFLVYMIAGSTLMVAAVLALYVAQLGEGNAGSFDFDVLKSVAASSPYAPWICSIFLLAFAVKTPLFPFHGWLPDAYYQAPTSGTILLSAILSKAGIYGILRISIGFFPALMQAWSPWLLGFSIAGVFYGGFAAWRQQDYKKMIAYSSFSHVNFILVGLFAWDFPANAGAILQALNHGITIAALFLVAGWLEERLNSTAMDKASGLTKFMPNLCWCTLFFVLASVALPGMNNFVGELMILFGLFEYNSWAAAVLVLVIILSVVYMLRWMQKVYFGEPSPFHKSWRDIQSKEIMLLLPFMALILWVGIYPAPFLTEIEPIVKNMIIEKSERP